MYHAVQYQMVQITRHDENYIEYMVTYDIFLHYGSYYDQIKNLKKSVFDTISLYST